MEEFRTDKGGHWNTKAQAIYDNSTPIQDGLAT